MSRKTRPPKRDAVAEQSLAATLRKIFDGNIKLSAFQPKQLEGGVALINAPVTIVLARYSQDYGQDIVYTHSASPQELEDDKSLAIHLAAALYGFNKYEPLALAEIERIVGLNPRSNGNGASIIKP